MTRIDRTTPPAIGQPGATTAPGTVAPTAPDAEQLESPTAPDADDAVTLSPTLRSRIEQRDATAGAADVAGVAGASKAEAVAAHQGLDPARVLSLLSD